jgi:hypothetical protein
MIIMAMILPATIMRHGRLDQMRFTPHPEQLTTFRAKPKRLELRNLSIQRNR